jgi:hypothetical protein
MPAKFKMYNDQTGETKEATLKTEADLRSQGFAVVNGGARDAAVAEAEAERTAKLPPEEESPQAQQLREDAALVAQRTYPDVDYGDAVVDIKPTKNPTDENDVFRPAATAPGGMTQPAPEDQRRQQQSDPVREQARRNEENKDK